MPVSKEYKAGLVRVIKKDPQWACDRILELKEQLQALEGKINQINTLCESLSTEMKERD